MFSISYALLFDLFKVFYWIENGQKSDFFSPKTLISLHACATTSNGSSMFHTKTPVSASTISIRAKMLGSWEISFPPLV